jgi:hypothetical protein
VIPYGSIYCLSIPVMSTKPLHGIASSGDKIRFGVNSISANSTWLYPEAWVVVADRLPAFNSIAAPTTQVAKRSFRANAEIMTWFRAGRVFFDYGPTTAYGSVAGPLDLVEGTGFGVWSDITGLQPGTTYHWRARFVGADGTLVMSPDQAVTTLPPDRFVLSVTSGTGGMVSKSPDAADYVEGTTVTLTATAQAGYRFAGWKLDGSSAGSAAQANITMDRRHDVEASFEILPVEMPPPAPQEPMSPMEPPPSMNAPQEPSPAPEMRAEPMDSSKPMEPASGGCQAAPVSAMTLAALLLAIRRRR